MGFIARCSRGCVELRKDSDVKNQAKMALAFTLFALAFIIPAGLCLGGVMPSSVLSTRGLVTLIALGSICGLVALALSYRPGQYFYDGYKEYQEPLKTS